MFLRRRLPCRIIDSCIGLAHTLFTLEDNYGLTVSEADGEVCLKVSADKGNDAAALLQMLTAWKAQANELAMGKSAVRSMTSGDTGIRGRKRSGMKLIVRQKRGIIMSDLPFSTLIKENDCKDRWYPDSIYNYSVTFIIDSSIENSAALIKNIAYNMQYIEFLEKEFEELNVSSVIYTMLVKFYVITAMSILEGIFSNIIKSNGWWKTTDMESLGVVTANEKKFGDEKFIVKSEILKRIEPEPLQMNLDEFIKILSKHHEALAIDHLDYPVLKRLKDLRNRVHIQKVSSDTDHDYNTFNYNVLQEMRKILYDVLSSEKICKNKNRIDFLNK